MDLALTARLERDAIPEPNSGCLLWMGAALTKGYGIAQWGKRGNKFLVHRLAWQAANGPIPEGKVICHKCDVPACINPTHLFAGTQSENIKDMYAKGRVSRYRGQAPLGGMKHPAAKLTDEIVRQIRSDSRPAKAWAAEIGVHQMTIYKIRNRRSWAHI